MEIVLADAAGSSMNGKISVVKGKINAMIGKMNAMTVGNVIVK